MNVKELLVEATRQLACEASGRLEAEILLGMVLNVNRAWLYANPEHVPGEKQRARYLDLVSQRKDGMPIAYLTQRREFWSMSLKVTQDVLIPRPETELLVETALAFIPEDSTWRIADLGTGSGAIALALARERPLCEIHATDYSARALAVARENEQALCSGRIQFHQGSWLEPLQDQFRVLVCNPPYVAANDPHLKRGDCRFEPSDALTPGYDAMSAIRHIAGEALHFLEPGGLLILEHGFDQGVATRQLLCKLGYRDVTTRQDLAGQDRLTWGSQNKT